MPCTKCKDGKYKWGESGECKYETKEACEKANHKYNKMEKPTPLGKTTEEYQKELKEFNLNKVKRVELGFTDDIKPEMNKAETALKGMTKAVNTSAPLFSRSKELRKEIANLNSDLGRMQEETIADIDNGEAAIRNLEKNISGIEKAARDIGISVYDIPGYSRALELIKSLLKAIPATKKVRNNIDDAYVRSS